MNPATSTLPNNKRRKLLLEAKLRELLSSSVHREELEIQYLPDPVDQIASNYDREMALRSVDHQSRLMQDVRSALEAIADGTYGACAECEEIIPGRRLDAVPWARLCVRCQTAAEAEQHGEEVLFTRAA